MKKCLKKEELINGGNPDIKIKFGEKDFLKAVNLIADDINKNYSGQKIGLRRFAFASCCFT